MEELERSKPELAKLGLRDRFGARGFYLHVQGYHEGALTYEEAGAELDRVESYIRDVEAALSRRR